jgi:ABC-type molybdate transport system substrate-binding protein
MPRAPYRAGCWQAIAAKAARTQNARQALDYVAHAEVDATFVCATDAPVRKDQVGVVFTMATEIPTTFHVAVVVGQR